MGLSWPLAEDGGDVRMRVGKSRLWPKHLAGNLKEWTKPLSWPYPPSTSIGDDDDDNDDGWLSSTDPYDRGYGALIFSVSGWLRKNKATSRVGGMADMWFHIDIPRWDEDRFFLEFATIAENGNLDCIRGNYSTNDLLVDGMFVTAKLRLSGVKEVCNSETGSIIAIRNIKTLISLEPGWDWLPFSTLDEAWNKMKSILFDNLLLRELWLIVLAFAVRPPTLAVKMWQQELDQQKHLFNHQLVPSQI